MKDDFRKDSTTAQFDVILIMLSITTFTEFILGKIDTKGAYIQSDPIKQIIFWGLLMNGRDGFVVNFEDF